MKDDERERLRARYRVTAADEAGYSMPDERDYRILAAVKALEGNGLSPEDADLVRLIRSQLLDDWRQPLLDKLDELLAKHGSRLPP